MKAGWKSLQDLWQPHWTNTVSFTYVDKTEIQSSHLISVVNIRYVVLYLQMTERRGWDVFSLLQKVVAKQQRLCQPAGLPAQYIITVSDQCDLQVTNKSLAPCLWKIIPSISEALIRPTLSWLTDKKIQQNKNSKVTLLQWTHRNLIIILTSTLECEGL